MKPCSEATDRLVQWCFVRAVFAVFALGTVFCSVARSETVIVENGAPRASIVIAAEPPRLVELAARELQEYIQKMSGAELPIGTAPDPALPVTVYIGRSAFTDAQGLTDEGLYHGAYRMLSGDNWLVLLGRDRDFEPVEPWPRTRHDFPETQAAWEDGRKKRSRPHNVWPHLQTPGCPVS